MSVYGRDTGYPFTQHRVREIRTSLFKISRNDSLIPSSGGNGSRVTTDLFSD